MTAASVTGLVQAEARRLVEQAAQLPDWLATANDDELLDAITDTANLLDYLTQARDLMYDVRRSMYAEGKRRGVRVTQLAAAAGVTPEAVTIALRKP